VTEREDRQRDLDRERAGGGGGAGAGAGAGGGAGERAGEREGWSEREAILRRFHAARPGATSAALARGGTYHRLAALVPAGARVLDLAAGDGYLCELLAARGARAVGVDFSLEELALFQARMAVAPAGAPWPVAARAQELPFADEAFDACVCHLALMLMEDAPAVVGELLRVLRPGGLFAAGDDAFHRFLAIAGPRLRGPRFGDPRVRSEAGWRELFAGWDDLGFERWEVDLGGTLDEVWRFLGASYQLSPEDAGEIRTALAASLAEAGLSDEQGRVPCRIVTWLGMARRGRAARAALRRS
jgi:SAM-dependent methyltransferase